MGESWSKHISSLIYVTLGSRSYVRILQLVVPSVHDSYFVFVINFQIFGIRL